MRKCNSHQGTFFSHRHETSESFMTPPLSLLAHILHLGRPLCHFCVHSLSRGLWTTGQAYFLFPTRVVRGSLFPPAYSAAQHVNKVQYWFSDFPWWSLPSSPLLLFKKITLGGIYVHIFWLCCVFVAAHSLSMVAVSRGYSFLQCTGFSLRWFVLWSASSVAVVHSLAAPRYGGSSCTRDRTRVSRVGRQILNHWPPEKSCQYFLVWCPRPQLDSDVPFWLHLHSSPFKPMCPYFAACVPSLLSWMSLLIWFCAYFHLDHPIIFLQFLFITVPPVLQDAIFSLTL